MDTTSAPSVPSIADSALSLRPCRHSRPCLPGLPSAGVRPSVQYVSACGGMYACMCVRHPAFLILLLNSLFLFLQSEAGTPSSAMRVYMGVWRVWVSMGCRHCGY